MTRLHLAAVVAASLLLGANIGILVASRSMDELSGQCMANYQFDNGQEAFVFPLKGE